MNILMIDVNAIRKNPQQPRKYFDPAALDELTASVREHGVLLPIQVQDNRDGTYTLIAGERRWLASQKAEKKVIPAIVVDLASDADRLVLALIENVQRQDMTPIEEAEAYSQLVASGHSIAKVSQLTGKDRVMIDNRLLLLKYELEIRQAIHEGRFFADPRLAREMLKLEPAKRIKLFKTLVASSASLKKSIAAAKKLAADGEKLDKALDGPAMTLARQKQTKEFTVSKWDALAQLGKLPPWAKVVQAAKGTCGKCSIQDIASEVQCGGCGAVDLLIILMGDV
jgi:ParB family chromosome partitioning protein